MPPRVDNLLVAGYVIARPTRRPDVFPHEVPDPFLTMSSHVTDDVLTPQMSGWFQDVDEAREIQRQNGEEWLLVAVCIGSQDADVLQAEMADEPRHFDLLRAARPAPDDIDWRGYEIVGADYSLLWHSWHCHFLASEASTELGIRLNSDGLLDRYDEAARVRDWMLQRWDHSVAWIPARLGVFH